MNTSIFSLLLAAAFVTAGCAGRKSSAPTDAEVASAVAASYYIYVGGEVNRPGPMFLSKGLTLKSAIQNAGGFKPSADLSHLRLTHVDGSTQVVDFGSVDSSPNLVLTADVKVFVPKL
jgi:protein involved in polysaccharide export with SLBB domain